ncbi:MAG TPA: nitroreductase family protein [Kangiella sp.]
MKSGSFEVTEDHIISLLSYAVLAPSSHNTQPWQFEVSDGIIYLFADRSRSLPVNDPNDRELTISCGCALMNLRVAAAHHGIGLDIALFPDADNLDLLATIRVDTAELASTNLSHLFSSIKTRRTYRKHFSSNKLPPSILETLSATASDENCWLDIIESSDTRQQISQLVFDGDIIQWANSDWRRELAAWMHSLHQGDGLTVPALIAPVAKIVVRTLNMGNSVGAKDKQLSIDSPMLAILGSEGDKMDNWLTTGQALQKVLLMAQSFGLQASYLNQPIQVSSLRPQLQELLQQTGFPQILLRLGFPEAEVKAAPRRALKEVIDFK